MMDPDFESAQDGLKQESSGIKKAENALIDAGASIVGRTNDFSQKLDRVASLASDYDTVSESYDGKFTPTESEAEATVKMHHVRIEWIDRYFKLRPAASNDIDLPDNIATFTELTDLVKDDAGCNVPFQNLIFFAYNKHGNLVALGSENRLRKWIKDLGDGRPAPAVLWIANRTYQYGMVDQPAQYMTAIEKFTAERRFK